MAVYAKDTLGKAKAAVTSDLSSDYVRGLSEAFQGKFKEKGGSIVTEPNYQAKDTDFNAQLTKTKGVDLDVICIPGYYNEIGPIIEQAREMGIDVPIVDGDGFDSTNLVKLAGNKSLSDVFFMTVYTAVDTSDALTQFVADHRKEYNKDPDMFPALTYGATNVLIQSFERAGGADTEAAQKAITELDFKGVAGDSTFNGIRTPKKAAPVVKLVDGE